MAFLLGVTKMFKIDVLVDAQICEYTKTHLMVHFKWVSYMVYELCLTKSVISEK